MTPEVHTSALQEFRPNDAVQILDRHGDLPAGATGRVIGRFARSEPTYLVSFGAEVPCVQFRSLQKEIVRHLFDYRDGQNVTNLA